METLIKAQSKYNPHSKIRNFELDIHSREQGRGSWTEPTIFDTEANKLNHSIFTCF